jgi:4-alpha-glucanotransferase
LRVARERLAHEIAGHRFVQYEFDRQWRALRDHAHRRGIGLIGDLPIFVAHDSADVWSHPELFHLDRRGQSRRVSGYPPDRFNRKGQHWGHPQYDWAAHEQTGFAWWIRRFARAFELFDAVRIDHFLGFTRTWSIPAHAKSARSGRWVKSPGFKLFAAVERKLGLRPMIAEDLGHVTPADIRLRDSFDLAPMRIFQFGFGSEPDSADHLPHNYSGVCAAYTGNHDNDTTVGWFRHLHPAQLQRVRIYTGAADAAPQTGAIRALMGSPANAVIIPMQDVLGLDGRARMNTPGTIAGNWRWRMQPMKLDRPAGELRALAEAFGRDGVARSAPRHVKEEQRSP